MSLLALHSRSPTRQQRRACEASGNILLMAGAGTGKTWTLVERCLALLLREKNPIGLDEMLIVTFTETAAAEMRKRLRLALDAACESQPENPGLVRQRALLDVAQISTLHSFCLRVVQDGFHELGLEPRVSILPPRDANVLRGEALAAVLRPHYASTAGISEDLLGWINQRGQGRARSLEEAVRKIYAYTQSLPDGSRWLAEQTALFKEPTPRRWEEWLAEGVLEWSQTWRELLAGLPGQPPLAAEARRLLAKHPDHPSRELSAGLLEELAALPTSGKKNPGAALLKELIEEASFLRSLCPVPNGGDPLLEDWNLVRGQMLALLQLTAELGAEFSRLKRARGVVDFADLEQFSLRLLQNPESGSAREWREKLKMIFVDEYQDINPIQDALLTCLAREVPAGNRFLVGDVKQSIYRFRLAAPAIFQGYARDWRNGAGEVIPLTGNFRSYEMLLRFINAFFARVMSPELGGVSYDATAFLEPSDPARREVERARAEGAGQSSPGETPPGPEPRVDIELLIDIPVKTGDRNSAETDESGEGEAGVLRGGQAEASLIADQLARLKASGFSVRDGTRERPVAWRDMVILQRSLANKTEVFNRVFVDAGIPLVVAPVNFYERPEIRDLLNLLRVLDNPIQDIPLAGVLASPLGGFRPADLVEVRLANRECSFWGALQIFHQQMPPDHGRSAGGAAATTWKLTDAFLGRFREWRRLAQNASVAQCLDHILETSNYETALGSEENGVVQQKNIRRFLEAAHHFDEVGAGGLHRFLRYVEAQAEAEEDSEGPVWPEADAVRLMTIHQSKGLEFPIVVVADLGKRFNTQDFGGEFLIDQKFGLSPRIIHPDLAQSYPSFPFWAARKRERLEMLGEELRLLYVAMTRAQDRLILVGTVTGQSVWKRWGQPLVPPAWTSLKNARSALDWVGSWVTEELRGQNVQPLQIETDWWEVNEGSVPLFRWRLHRIGDQVETCLPAPVSAEPAVAPPPSPAEHQAMSPEAFAAFKERLFFQYPFSAATTRPAKTSVSALRRLTEEEEEGSMALPVVLKPNSRHRRSARFVEKDRAIRKEEARAAVAVDLPSEAVGLAHHRFLELVSLEETASREALLTEADRLLSSGLLSADERRCLDLAAVAAFWQSEFGARLLDHAPMIQRELSFTVRFTPAELTALDPSLAGDVNHDFVVVQGIIDLAVIQPSEIWLLDFKTDAIEPSEVAARLDLYRPQLVIYAKALEKIYRRPVSLRALYFFALGRLVQLPETFAL